MYIGYEVIKTANGFERVGLHRSEQGRVYYKDIRKRAMYTYTGDQKADLREYLQTVVDSGGDDPLGVLLAKTHHDRVFQIHVADRIGVDHPIFVAYRPYGRGDYIPANRAPKEIHWFLETVEVTQGGHWFEIPVFMDVPEMKSLAHYVRWQKKGNHRHSAVMVATINIPRPEEQVRQDRVRLAKKQLRGN